MTAPRIALLALAPGRHMRQVAERLEALSPGAARLVDMTGPLPPLAVGEGAVMIDGLDAGGLRAVLVHGFQYQDPVVPAAADHADFSLWQADYPAEQQRWSALFSLLARLEALGVPVWNGAGVHLAAFSRPAVLQDWRRDGLPVCETLLTNEADAAAAFCADGRAVVWRTATGRCPWQHFGDRQRRHLVDGGKPPVLLAEAVAGRVIRSYVVGGRVALSLEGAAPDAGGLERLEVFRAVEVPPAAADIVGRAAASLGAAWAMVLWVDGTAGPVLYDVDVDPVLDTLPVPFADRLAGLLAAALLGRPGEAVTASAPAERPVLFLRRMLRILFDIEATKFRGPSEGKETPRQ